MDRLQIPVPEGLELYLAADDIQGPNWFDDAVHRIQKLDLAADFDFRVESPVRALGGEFFNVARDSPSNRETLSRVARFGGAIAASSACVHLIAPTTTMHLSDQDRSDALASSVALLEHYARVCAEYGLIPTIENVPPIGQMREALAMTSPIGVFADDFLRCIQAVPSLRVTFDTSHAGMAQRFVRLCENDIAPEHRTARQFFAANADESILDSLDRLGDYIRVSHVSASRGYRGEGLPYETGDIDLDRVVDRLLTTCDAIVAEVLEPDPDASQDMRATAERIARRRDRSILT